MLKKSLKGYRVKCIILPTKQYKGREVVDYPDKLLSPTELDTFDMCEAKWGFRWKEKIYSPPNKFAQLGIDTHQELEDWIGEGKPVVSDILIPAQKHFPMPSETVFAERMVGFEVTTIEGEKFGYHGKVDVTDATNPSLPGVYDLKTTGDFGWAKTPEQLEKDIQRAIYVQFALTDYQANEALCRWVYAKTTTPYASKPVELLSSREQTESFFQEKIIPLSRRVLKASASDITVKDLEKDYTACGAFGGCPNIDRCAVTARQRIFSKMAQEQVRNAVMKKSNTVIENVTDNGEKKMSDAKSKMAALLEKKKGAQVAAAASAKVEKVAVQAVNPPDASKDETEENVTKAQPSEEAEATPEAEAAPEIKSASPVKPQNKKPATVKAASKPPPAEEGFTLYIDCVHLKGNGHTKSVHDEKLNKDGLYEDLTGHYAVFSNRVSAEVLQDLINDADVVVQGV